MTRLTSILLALFATTAVLRADLTLEQKAGDTNRTINVITMVHGTMMRMQQPGSDLVVIASLATHDSFTLLTNKTYMKRWGSDVKWELQEELKNTHGTNEMDAPPHPAVDTGKSETVNGYNAEIYAWSGAYGIKETLWVAKDYPNYRAIRIELLKMDMFNDTGQHRNAQPRLSALPGMVVKSEAEMRGKGETTTLVSAKLEPLDDSLFKVPDGYTLWKRPAAQNNQTNSPPAQR
jgi:hypothetical protein